MKKTMFVIFISIGSFCSDKLSINAFANYFKVKTEAVLIM